MFFSIAIVKVPAAACQTQAADDMRNVRNMRNVFYVSTSTFTTTIISTATIPTSNQITQNANK